MARATNKHATTHRSRGLGGTDPVPPDLPYMSGFCSSQTFTDNGEVEWESVFTNDPDTFLYDPDDPAGLLLRRGGLYRYMAKLRVASGEISVERGMSIQSGSYSSGPIGGSAIVDAGNSWWSGHTSVTADAWTVAVMMWEDAINGNGFFSTPWDPARIALVIDHRGTNFTALDTTLYVMKLESGAGGTGTPALPDEPPP